MSHRWIRIVIFIFLSFSQTVPALSQEASDIKNKEDKTQYAFNLFEIMKNGPEKEKRLAWQKFVESLPSYFSTNFMSQYERDSLLLSLRIVINEMPEPYKSMSWEEITTRLASSNLNSDFLVQIIITAPEPYKIWAWQQLQVVLQRMKDERRIFLAELYEIDRHWIYIIRQAPEPYKRWTWQELLSDKSSPNFFDNLIGLIEQDRGQYSELAWIEIAKQESEFWTEEKIYLLKRIMRIPNLHYQKLAVSKLLTLKSLSPQDRETAKEMYRVFYSEENEDNYYKKYIN